MRRLRLRHKTSLRAMRVSLMVVIVASVLAPSYSFEDRTQRKSLLGRNPIAPRLDWRRFSICLSPVPSLGSLSQAALSTLVVCSFGAVSPPPSTVPPQKGFTDCTTSRGGPILDTGAVYALIPPDSNREASAALGLAALVWGVAALYGFEGVAQCRALVQKQEIRDAPKGLSLVQ